MTAAEVTSTSLQRFHTPLNIDGVGQICHFEESLSLPGGRFFPAHDDLGQAFSPSSGLVRAVVQALAHGERILVASCQLLALSFF